MPDVTCSRCGQTRSGFDRAPFPGQVGARVVKEICQQCWADWLKQQTMLINHYGLNVMDPQARAPRATSRAVLTVCGPLLVFAAGCAPSGTATTVPSAPGARVAGRTAW